LVSAETKEIDIYNPTLTLTGLLLLYRKNRKSNPRIDEYEE
ncbi:MAG: pantothenate kinase, partial [Lachnospiraceae bacterium]|nr:pantothenate kinase [Lachnospiraceae bacterium]